MNQKNKIIFLSSLIIGVLTLTLGVTFAIFNFSKTSTNSKLIVGDIYMHYNDASQGINLENMVPLEEYTLNTSDEAITTCVEYLYDTYGENWNYLYWDNPEAPINNKYNDIKAKFMSTTYENSYSNYCAGYRILEPNPVNFDNSYTIVTPISIPETGIYIMDDFKKGVLTSADKTYLEENDVIINNVKNLSSFEFTISGKNTTKDKDVYYEIVLTHGNNHPTRTIRIRDDLLKFRLVEIKDGVETVIVKDKSYDDLNNHRIWVDTINKNTTSEVVHTYRLYMWIDNNTVIGNVDQDYTMEEWNNLYASIKVNVTGDFNEKELAYEDKYNPTDASCFTTSEYNLYQVNNNMTTEELNKCINYLTESGMPLTDGVTMQQFCQGTGTSINGYTFQQNLDNNAWFPLEVLNYLEGNNIIKSVIGLSITDYDESCGTDVVIPKTINGNNITIIGEGAFEEYGLTSVVIPNSIKTIGHAAFRDNQLTNVEIPNSVTEIDNSAFNANQLSDDEAFIYARTDKNSDGIAEIDYTTIVSYGGINKEPIIPNSVTTIGNDAFCHNELKSIIIPDSVTTIGYSAFWYNELKSIIIPDSVTTIGYSAFSQNQLTNVTIGSGIEYIGKTAFEKDSYSNPNLSSITINKSCSDIKKIPAYSTDSTKYYPWLSSSSPYTASGVTIYGTGSEVCDSY